MWELEYNGLRQSFAVWGLNGLSVEKVSSAADSIRFTAVAAAFDSAQQFAYDAKVTLWRAGVRHFAGRITTPPRSGTPYGESLAYTAKGPWNELEQIVYEQFWRSIDGDLASTTVILGKAQANTRITIGAQIREILDFAIGQGATCRYVAADLAALDITPPESEATDITCAAALLNLLNWHKDFTTWFDYSAATPVLRFSKRSAAEAGSINVAQGAPNEEIFITRREDLKLRGVVINYSITNTENGKAYFGLRTDTAGETSGRNVLKSTVELEGSSVERLSQKIKSDTIPSVVGEFDGIALYLKNLNPWLFSDEIASQVWSNHTIENPDGLSCILTEGNVQDWMNKKASTGSISARVDVTYKDGSVKSFSISSSETFTDAESGTYTKTQNYVAGEAIPAGLASKIYSQFQAVQFEGAFTLLEEEVSGTWHPGKVLNLTGGLAEWAGMRAQIQQVQENIDEGRTIITFGPAEHLSPQDFVELLRVNRIRKTTDNSELRATGEMSSKSSVVELTGAAPRTVVSGGLISDQRCVISTNTGTDADPVVKSIDLNPKADSFKPGKALVVKQDGLTTDWGDAMPPIGDQDAENMVMTIRRVKPAPTNESPDPAPVKTPVWGWIRLVESTEQ